MRLPPLETPRLLLRERSLADVPALLALNADPQVMHFLGGTWKDEAAARQRLVAAVTREWATGLGYWSVFAREAPDVFLGWILLTPVEGQEADIEIGWRFMRAAWGRGYASEAAARVLRHAFEAVNLGTVIALVDPGNAASAGVALRIGLRADGRRMAYGRELDVFSLDRASWRTATGAPQAELRR